MYRQQKSFPAWSPKFLLVTLLLQFRESFHVTSDEQDNGKVTEWDMKGAIVLQHCKTTITTKRWREILFMLLLKCDKPQQEENFKHKLKRTQDVRIPKEERSVHFLKRVATAGMRQTVQWNNQPPNFTRFVFESKEFTNKRAFCHYAHNMKCFGRSTKFTNRGTVVAKQCACDIKSVFYIWDSSALSVFGTCCNCRISSISPQLLLIV